MAVWPPSLPQQPLLGAAAALPDLVLRTPMQQGPAKVRRVRSDDVRPQSLPMFLTDAQRATFETFFVTTIAGGSLPFDLTDVTDQTVASFRIVTPPPPVPVDFAPGWWRLTLTVERLP